MGSSPNVFKSSPDSFGANMRHSSSLLPSPACPLHVTENLSDREIALHLQRKHAPQQQLAPRLRMCSDCRT